MEHPAGAVKRCKKATKNRGSRKRKGASREVSGGGEREAKTYDFAIVKEKIPLPQKYINNDVECAVTKLPTAISARHMVPGYGCREQGESQALLFA